MRPCVVGVGELHALNHLVLVVRRHGSQHGAIVAEIRPWVGVGNTSPK